MATTTKSLLASLLFAVAGVASASGLYIDGLSGPLVINGYNPAPATANYTSGYFGKVMASSPGTVTATYLGQESGYVNSYSLDFFSNMLLESHTPGTEVSALITGAAPILLDFSFNTKNNSGNYIGEVANGNVFSVNSPSFAILGNYLASQTATIAGQARTFDYILGFNDSYTGDADFDDFVVGINFKPSVVPLPAAAWLFGSALFGFMMVSNRRKV